MKETAETKEINSEREKLKNLLGIFKKPSENLSVIQAEEKLSERIDIGASPEKIEKKITAAKKEINKILAEKYSTTPEFEELRSKSKINQLTTWEKIKYAQMALLYPERAEISDAEQKTTNLHYEESKKYKIDFQILDTLHMLDTELKEAKSRGTSLSPQESDLRDKLVDIYATKRNEHYEERIARARAVLLT